MWKLCKQPVDSTDWEDNEESIKRMVVRLVSFIKKKILTWWSTVGRYSSFNQHSRLRFWRARCDWPLTRHAECSVMDTSSVCKRDQVLATVLPTLLSPQINRLCDLHTWICKLLPPVCCVLHTYQYLRISTHSLWFGLQPSKYKISTTRTVPNKNHILQIELNRMKTFHCKSKIM